MAQNSVSGLRALRPQLDSVYFYKAPPLRRRTPRSGGAAELILMLDGVYVAREPTMPGKPVISARSGDAVYWPAGAARVEENDPASPMQCYAIYIHWRQAPALPRVVHDEAGTMRYLAAQLSAIKESPVPMPAGVSNAFLAAILAEFIRRAITPADPLEAKVLAYLARHRTDGFRLEQLARFVGLERHHFGRIFKTRTGYSPMDYVRRKRLAWAVNLIGGVPGISTQAIAERVGIRDNAELLRQLRRYTGWGKRALRRMMKTGGPLLPIFPGHELMPT